MGSCRGGEAKVRPKQPPQKKSITIYGDHFGTSFSQDRHFSPCEKLFRFFMGDLFGLAPTPPPPLQKCLRAPMTQNPIAWRMASRHANFQG